MRNSVAALALAASMVAVAPVSSAVAQTAPQKLTFVTEQAPGQVATVRLAGTRVFNSKGEVMGTIVDVVLDKEGKAQTVVLGLGGFLGLGRKEVAVPYSALKVGPVVESSRVLLISATTEELKAAPAYKATEPSRTDRAQKKASEWIKIAKDKALELGKQAGEAVESMREKMTTEGEAKK
jgi:sporulation protein YlmC with PRC-barrel domain